MYEEIRNKLKSSMSERRYRHSLGVADEAKRLAAVYDADEEKAYLAGLVHDCAKEIAPDIQIKMCADLNIALDDIMKLNTGLIHGPLGAETARRDYGICDEEILGAIRWHTIGKAGMTVLEKIVYIADMTEKNRDFNGVKELREAVDTDLDEAILLSISQHMNFLAQRKSVIHPNMILLWNDLTLNRGGTEHEQ